MIRVSAGLVGRASFGLRDGLMNPLKYLAMKALSGHAVIALGPFGQAEIAIAVLASHQHGKWLTAAALLHLGRHVADGQPYSWRFGAVGIRAMHDPQVVH